MSDDHIKRFRLSEKQPHRSFNPAVRQISTKDNAQPTPPKPRFVRFDLPGLAPPGAVGVRLENDARRWMAQKRQESEAERPFRPLVERKPDNGRER